MAREIICRRREQVRCTNTVISSKPPEVNLLPSIPEVSWRPQPGAATGLTKTSERLLNEAVRFPSFAHDLEICKLQSHRQWSLGLCAADRRGRGGEGGERLHGQGEAPDPQGSSEEAGEPSEGVSSLRAPLNGVVRTGRPGAPPEQAGP